MINHSLYRLLKHISITLFAFVSIFQTAHAQAPLSNFTSNRQAGCSPLSVTFQDLSTGNPTSWYWDFGNGITSTVQNPSTFYFTPGSYAVKLMVTNASGTNSLVRTNYINIYESPTVNFIADDTTGCFPHKVKFTDLSTPGAGNTITSWLWDYNTGIQDSIKNPSTTFNNSGSYTVFLKVTNDKGCFRVLSKPSYINVTSGVTAGFNNTTPTVCRPPASISFSNTSTGPGSLTYLWDFGDGNTSTQQNPTHIYTTAGTYSVTLTTTSSSGCVDVIKKTNVLTIGGITTSFSAPDAVCINSNVNFLNTSSPAPVSSTWTFGDATTSTQTNPTKVYTTPNTYTVRLVNTYSNCSDSAFKTINVYDRAKPEFTSNETVKCQPPFTVNFQDLSTGAVSWKWDFGDGNTSTLQNPTHTYINYGNYNVKLVVTNISGCVDSIVKSSYIKVRRAIMAVNNLPIEGCVPFTINPVPAIQTLDAITSYKWDFGDGTTSTQQNPTHTYNIQGDYDVSLIITTSTGCTDTLYIKNAVRVGTKPTAQFDASPNPVCAYKPIAFNNLSSTTDRWIWSFGDGGGSSQQHPSYTYTATGSYTVTLIAINFGCRDTIKKTNYVTVLPPISKFSSTPNCSNRLEFSFKDESTGPVSWLWNFGDGNTSTLQNPTHTYSEYKNYTVSLTVTNGSCSHTSSKTIKTIKEAPDFSTTSLIGCKPYNTTFTVQNVNPVNIVSYNWTFGDGGSTTNNNPTTSYTYSTSGKFDVRMITTDLNGCKDTVERKNYITVYGGIAKFSATNTSGCFGFTTTFNDLSTTDGVNKITEWKWDFGDGTIKTFTAPPFQHTYNIPGTFSVKLVITDEYGCKDSVTMNNLINATNPKAAFISTDTLSCPNATVRFTNQSSGINYTSYWEFGNGLNSTTHSPTTTYSTVTNYSVKLVITDQYGCKDSITKTDYIKLKVPVANFTMSDSVSSCTPFEVNYSNTSTYYSSFFWDFGPGGTTNLPSPTFYYTSPGDYQTKLVITSPGGCKDSIIKNIKVYDTTGSRIDYSPLNGCSPLSVNFTAYTAGQVSEYIWDFGDGITRTTTTPSVAHSYNRLGNFIPKLIMMDPTGCPNPVRGADSILISGAKANFTLNKNLLCDSGFVNFSDSTIFNDPVTNYNWSFGDGNTSTLQSPAHKYLNPGNYNVTLAVQTQMGCRDTIQKMNFVKVVQSPSIKISGDSVACIFTSMQHYGAFNRPDTSVVNWNWTFPNGNSASQINPPPQRYNIAGTFTVTAIATNSSGCKDTTTKRIRVNPLPTSSVQDTITILSGNPVTIPITYAPNVATYLWTPATGLSCTTCPQPSAVPKFTTSYNVFYVDSNGCTNTDTIKVIVLCKNANLFIPNTFSPNGDGSNDIFYPRGTGIYGVKSFRIFNRWGEVVFEKRDFPINDPISGWNGTYKGNKPLQDVYIYQLEVFCDNGQLITQNGNIALIL